MAARTTATEQIISTSTALRYLGIPIHGPSIPFGDNRSVVNSSSVPHSKLSKRHVTLSYYPQSARSCGWGYQQVRDQFLHALLFMPGKTADDEVDEEQQAQVTSGE
jgi:hypothetical protein